MPSRGAQGRCASTGAVKVNGAAARLVHTGDTVIVVTYGQYAREELEHYEPRVVHVDRYNQVVEIDSDPTSLLDSKVVS